MHQKVSNTFDTYAAASFDKQTFLTELIANTDADFDLQRGVVSFGQHQWKCQVLGIQPDLTGQFQWIWSVDQTEIPQHLLKWSQQIREVGVREGITELMEAMPSSGECDGHTLSIMSTGICQANGYFCGQYHEGTLFMLIRDSSFPVSTESPIERFLANLPKAVRQFPVANHRRTVVGFARYLGLNVQKLDDRMIVDDGAHQVVAVFDEEKRLRNLSPNLKLSVTAR